MGSGAISRAAPYPAKTLPAFLARAPVAARPAHTRHQTDTIQRKRTRSLSSVLAVSSNRESDASIRCFQVWIGGGHHPAEFPEDWARQPSNLDRRDELLRPIAQRARRNLRARSIVRQALHRARHDRICSHARGGNEFH